MKIITLTAGHGGNDPGATRRGLSEAVLMADLRDMVAAEILAAGRHQVRTDGDAGANWSLAQALRLVPGSAIACELHTNAVDDPQANGVECCSYEPQQRQAMALASTTAAALGLKLRRGTGWLDGRKTPRGSLGYCDAGGVVLETFFLSNPAETARFLEQRHLLAMALATELMALADRAA